jgi:hypothetical protein
MAFAIPDAGAVRSGSLCMAAEYSSLAALGRALPNGPIYSLHVAMPVAVRPSKSPRSSNHPTRPIR